MAGRSGADFSQRYSDGSYNSVTRYKEIGSSENLGPSIYIRPFPCGKLQA